MRWVRRSRPPPITRRPAVSGAAGARPRPRSCARRRRRSRPGARPRPSGGHGAGAPAGRPGPPAATVPIAAAAAGRTQVRGSCSDRSSHASSSSAASAWIVVSVSSSRTLRCSGGSTGASARLSSASRSLSRDWRAHRPHTSCGSPHDPLELLDRAMDQHLGGAVGAAERPRDLAVVHAEREAHDQRLAAVVRQLLHALEDLAQLLAALDEILGRVQRLGLGDRVQRGLRLARAVAVVVRGEVVGDADQPRPQRPAGRLGRARSKCR